LPAHQHHEEETEKEKAESRQEVLNSDHFVVGRENVFSPETKLVMVVLGVSVRMVFGVRDGRRGVHKERLRP
jgi:hypothetical protein